MLEVFNLFNITNILGISNVNYSGYSNVLVRDSDDPANAGIPPLDRDSVSRSRPPAACSDREGRARCSSPLA